MKINGKVVMVTGASEGIGAACARCLAQRGAQVSVNVLDGAAAPSADGADLLVTEGDITRDDVRRRFVGRTLERYGTIDILINNAGVGLYGLPTEAPLTLVRQIFETNVFAALGMAQIVAPHMKQRRSGTIVNIGSVGGMVTLPWASMYSATKYALHCISDGLRRELAPHGIRVMLVCPGIVETRFREHALAGNAPAGVKKIKRVVSPGRVAEKIARGVEREARLVYVPWIGRIFVALDYFLPGVMDAYLRSKMR